MFEVIFSKLLKAKKLKRGSFSVVTQRNEGGLDCSFSSAQHCLVLQDPHTEGTRFLKCPFTQACVWSTCLATGATGGPPRSSPLLDSAELIPEALNTTYLISKRSNFDS